MKRGRKSIREQYQVAKGIQDKEFFPTLVKDLEGVKTIEQATERIQNVTDGQVKAGAITLRNTIRRGCNGRVPKGSDAWNVVHISRGRKWPQNEAT